MPTELEFCLLGPLVVRSGGSAIPVQRGRLRAVLAVLLLNAGQVVQADQMVETLWGHAPPSSARVTVRNYVMRLRRALGEAGADRIRTHSPGYLMSVNAGELDVSLFQALLGSAREAAEAASWEAAASQASAALALWRGEPLADVDSELLVLQEVPRLAELRLQALETCVEADVRLGRDAGAIAELTRLVAVHPLREHLHALLMLALYRSGRQADALAAYQRARGVLVEELGTEPGPELREVHQQILTGDTAVVMARPRSSGHRAAPGCTQAITHNYHTRMVWSAAGTAPAGVHGLPPALTSFIGRAGAVKEVSGLLDQYRLVTVTGSGGSGKTRLAGEVAKRAAGRFADGVWLAELAAVADPALVASVVMAALGVREQPGVSATEALARALGRQELLLVLDNCEHVIGAAAGLCAGLLRAGDDVRILATSREPLRVAGEVRYRLAPLTVPDRDDLAGAAGCEAVALFTDRARRADVHFALDEETGPAVARLVARLDGMPLAIELAAARVEALGVAQLLERIDDRFGFLVAADRLAAGRQRSLAATVEWSYQLLDEQERGVFRALSVFPGPFTLQAAAAVAGADAGPVVLRLVDCSLLSPPRTGPDGRSRYVMLETLRAYGAGLLAEAGEDAGAAAALAGFALRVAEEAAEGLQTTTGELAAARRLDAEDATMRRALAWTMARDPAAGLRL